MTVQFILGRSGSGKTRTCLERIVTALAQGEEGPTLIWLVPEQATYQVERAVLGDPRISGFSRLRVLSFNRLAFHLLNQAPGRRDLSRIGRQLLLAQLLDENRDQLAVLRPSTGKPGLVEAVDGLISECQHQNCSARDLADAGGNLPEDSLSALKLHDLGVILQAYEDTLSERNHELVDPNLDLNQARVALAGTGWLHGAHLWIDGFTGFTGQEWGLLAELLRCVAHTEIALCLDPMALDLGCRDPQALNPESLFNATERLYVDFAGQCERLGLELVAPNMLTSSRRFKHPTLSRIESELYADVVGQTKGESADTTQAITIKAAPHARAEIDYVARGIVTQVRQRGLRYRDIAVVVPNLEHYQATIEAAFQDAQIPYFLDRPRSLSHHPLVSLIDAALRVALEGFQTADVMSLLKTDLGPFDRAETDILEDYCVTMGMDRRDWTRVEPWPEKTVEDLRVRVRDPLTDLSRALAGATVKPTCFVQALWSMLTQLKVPDTLSQWQGGDESLHSQALDKVVDLMDQFVWILGASPKAGADLADSFVQGLRALNVNQIPPTLDQVLVGSIERSRHPDVHAAFLVGVTQRHFPIPLRFDTLLTDTDRSAANQFGLNLNPPALDELMQRRYLAYIALTRASDFISISYPVVDRGGATQEPAAVINELLTLFPDLQVQTLAEEIPALDHITHTAGLADVLCMRLSQTDNPIVVQQAAQIVAGLCDGETTPIQRMGRILRTALQYDNQATITSEQAQRFCGEMLSCSATALESYAACPYRYYAGKMLRLQPRRPLGFDALDSGDLYHRVLDTLFRKLQREGQSIRDLEAATLESATDLAYNSVVKADKRIERFMGRDGQRHYTVERLRSILRACVQDLAAMAKAGSFVPVATELSFGPDGDLPSLVFVLAPGRSMQLIGRIDRVDLSPHPGGGFTALVMDYKKGATSAKFDLGRWFHGLSLQTSLYALVVEGATISSKSVTSCGGALLIPVEVPATSCRYGDIKKEEFKRKARGLFDGSLAGELDANPGSRGSRYYSFYLKQGEPYGREATSSAYRPLAYQHIRAHTRHLIEKLGQRICSGDIAISPFSLGTESACDFCDYAAVCKFDWQITPPRLLPKLERSDVLSFLEETYD